MKEFKISCLVRGYLPERPYEDGNMTDALLDAFDEADCGVLHNIDLDGEDTWSVTGHYSFAVKAASEQEALSLAPAVFTELWDNGDVDCGDLEDTDRVSYSNGEEFRCSGTV